VVQLKKRQSQHEWLSKQVQRILDMTNNMLKIDSEQYNDYELEYGFWSVKKELALAYLVRPFCQIAKRYFKAFYYLDLFAGSGMMKADSQTFFAGSPIVVLGSTPPETKFAAYHCCEIRKERHEALQNRVKIAAQVFGMPTPSLYNCDCNAKIDDLLTTLCPKGARNTCFLAFIDPEGLEIDWNTVQTLLHHCRGDLLFTFSTMGVIRNIGKSDSNALNRFFGDEKWKKLDTSRADIIVDYYKLKLEEADRRVFSFPVIDEYNHRLYDMILATGSSGMANAIRDLTTRLNAVKTKDISNMADVLTGKTMQLGTFPSG